MSEPCPHGKLTRRCEVCELEAEIARLRARVEKLEARLVTALEALQRLAITYELEWEPPEAGAPFSRPAWLVSVLDNYDNARLVSELRALREEHDRISEMLVTDTLNVRSRLLRCHAAVEAARKA